ncbi:MAG: 4Fe-4S dicluster domain-containing protein [Planctomycetota bacterium]
MTGRAVAGVSWAEGGVEGAVVGGGDREGDWCGLVSALPAAGGGEPAACVSCGWCAEVCPTGLWPIELLEVSRNKSKLPRVREELSWCLECGLCTHVCPSQIRLSQGLSAARGAVLRG